jgi:hypothetical protein
MPVTQGPNSIDIYCNTALGLWCAFRVHYDGKCFRAAMEEARKQRWYCSPGRGCFLICPPCWAEVCAWYRQAKQFHRADSWRPANGDETIYIEGRPYPSEQVLRRYLDYGTAPLIVALPEPAVPVSDNLTLALIT